MTAGGTLPRRNPGTLICWAIFLYAASRLGLSSSKGTSTVSLARVGLKVSTALFTGVLLISTSTGGHGAAVLGPPVGRAPPRAATSWSGRQDSNLRSPAPKAGALATTLRPGSGDKSPRESTGDDARTRNRHPTGARRTIGEPAPRCGTMVPLRALHPHADVAQW